MFMCLLLCLVARIDWSVLSWDAMMTTSSTHDDCLNGADAINWLLNNLNPVGLLKDGGQLSQ